MRAYGGPSAVGDVVVDGSQDFNLDALFLHDRPRNVDQAYVCDTAGVRLSVQLRKAVLSPEKSPWLCACSSSYQSDSSVT
jgi:hypothetical protein